MYQGLTTAMGTTIIMMTMVVIVMDMSIHAGMSMMVMVNSILGFPVWLRQQVLLLPTHQGSWRMV